LYKFFFCLSRVVFFVTLNAIIGCSSVDNRSFPQDSQVEFTLDAAFVPLEYVDVYDKNGDFITTIGQDTDLVGSLPVGYYLMDFVTSEGEHAFMPDGRLAFAPMMLGGLPVHGPIFGDQFDAPVWGVEIHPDLEANARLTQRQREKDETLLPFRHYFKHWGERSSHDGDDLEVDAGFDEADKPILKAYDPYHNYTTSRLRVTWEASYAMTGDWNGSCNSAAGCWNQRSGGYAYWDKDSSGTGYIDSDTTAWSNAVYYYGGASSCTAGGYPQCYISVGTSNARNYTCQSGSGTCTGGSGINATKPHGGQCKMFSNLVFWRSGEYNSWGSWLTFPLDSNLGSEPYATTSNISVGDVLRKRSQDGTYPNNNPHAAIVVAYDSSINQALLVDSNWVSGNGYEYIGWHTLGFSGSDVYNLGNYRRMNCLYNASPCTN